VIVDKPGVLIVEATEGFPARPPELPVFRKPRRPEDGGIQSGKSLDYPAAVELLEGDPDRVDLEPSAVVAD